jgi:HupE / UreJ protein
MSAGFVEKKYRRSQTAATMLFQPMTKYRTSAILIILLLALMPATSAAHEIPSDVRVQMYVKPAGQRLQVLVRVPLKSITETEWPERASGLLDLSRADRKLREAAQSKIADVLAVFEGDRRLEPPQIVAVKASLPSDLSFDSFEHALAHVSSARLPDDIDFVTQQGLMDVLFEYGIQSQQSLFSIHPNFLQLGVTVTTVLRFLSPDQPERAFSLHDDPGLVRLDPRWFQAAGRFVVEGFFHILDGIDHLLFLFCLIIPFRRMRSLVLIVTSFTVAHSITLIASAYDMAPSALWFPPLVETLIATSIMYMALENIVSPALERRWIITFAFGLVHGFGFSFALRESLQFAGSHLLTSLVSFNLGVELGQLLVLLVLVPSLGLLFRYVVDERVGTIILSAFVAHTGWHWLTERFSLLRRYPIEMPVFNAAFFAALLRWMMLFVIVAAAAWLIFGVFGQRASSAKNEAVRS